jgi:Fe-S-cluster containining protein
MSNREFYNDPKEIRRLIEYHGCVPMKNEKGELGIKIPLSCIHLEIIEGKSKCRINDTKPVVCREYFCEKIIKKALEKELNGVHV